MEIANRRDHRVICEVATGLRHGISGGVFAIAAVGCAIAWVLLFPSSTQTSDCLPTADCATTYVNLVGMEMRSQSPVPALIGSIVVLAVVIGPILLLRDRHSDEA